MSERYTRLFALPDNLYSTGSPVLIVAGALLKDNNNNKVLVQLKIKNINKKSIKAVKVQITPFDTVGKPLGDIVEHQYLDITAKRDEDFGTKTPIHLPDSASRSFSVVVTEVAFLDNSVWNATNEPWGVLPAASRISGRDEELLKQYHMKYGADCIYSIKEHGDLWYCSCGALNRSEEVTCHKCRNTLLGLKSVDWKALEESRDKRLKQEKEQKEKAEEERNEKNRRLKKISLITVSSILLLVAAILLITKVIIPNVKYNSAEALINSGNYQDAINTFETLGDFKDCLKYIDYAKAEMLLIDEKYDEAYPIFETLEDFKNSKEKYETAKRLNNENLYEKAIYEIKNSLKDALPYLKGITDDYEPAANIKKIEHQYGKYCGVIKFYLEGFSDTIELNSDFSYNQKDDTITWLASDVNGESKFYYDLASGYKASLFGYAIEKNMKLDSSGQARRKETIDKNNSFIISHYDINTVVSFTNSEARISISIDEDTTFKNDGYRDIGKRNVIYYTKD